MRKKTTSTKSTAIPTSTEFKEHQLPDGFTAEPDKVISEVAQTEIAEAKETTITPVEETVPSIETNAELKIDSILSVSEEIPQSEKKGKLLFLFGSIIGILVISVTIILGYFYFRKPETKPVAQTPTPSATPVITATPTPNQIIKADISFDVLNSTDTKGLAAQYGKKLESLGYKVSKLGNSPDTVKGVQIFLSKEIEAQKDTLMSDLTKTFPEATYSGTLSGSTSLVRLIIGTTK